MRTLAIDLGDRRVGLAICDDAGILATPHDVLEVESPAAAIVPFIKLLAREEIKRVIVGLPLNMDDSLGPSAEKTMQWSRELAVRACIDVLLVDERLSTFVAGDKFTSRKR